MYNGAILFRGGNMKSEGVRDIVKWMEKQIKDKRNQMKDYDPWSDMGAEADVLDQMVAWKISTEKYMKKLQHNGE